MLNALIKWNRWGTAKLFGGHLRQITPKIYQFVNTKDIVVLIGLRRSGKTTIMFQLMDYLEEQKIPQEAALHVNFEEPLLGPQLGIELLDEIYQEFRKKVFPEGRAYLFFDEIQNVPGWERWVRARNESENIKIFLTGSSANLMSRELGTVLTGRHVSFMVHPLSFSEYLQFQNIQLPTHPFQTESSYEISYAFEQYLKWGALPEIVLSQSDERREYMLIQYFDDLLFKDVAMRHEIRDIHVLRNLAVYLLTQTASLVSYHRLSKQFDISIEKARSYCSCLEEAFLISLIPFFSLKAAERNRHPFKVYAVDFGLRNVAALTASQDVGRLIETAVYHVLKRKHHQQIYYWKDKHEIDFLLREGHSVTQLIQVAQHIDDKKTLQRELTALKEAQQKFPKATTKLIIEKSPKQKDLEPILLWRFLLGKSD